MNLISRFLFLAIFSFLFPYSLEAKEISLAEWKSLSEESQGRILSENASDYSNIDEFEFDETSLPPKFQKAFTLSKKTGDEIVEQLEFEDRHARVGPPTVSFVTVYVLENQVIGMNIGYSFEGCDMPDESNPYFKDEESAKHAGCEFSDVSWMWQGSFNELGHLLYDPGYPEWTGY